MTLPIMPARVSTKTSLRGPASAAPPNPALRRRARAIAHRLREFMGHPMHALELSPLDSLIGTILSQNTSDVNSGRAYDSLKARFPTWQAVLRAPEAELAQAIHSGGLENIKSARIQQVLLRLAQERGELSLDFLRDLPAEEARRYLLTVPGVGMKTASCVLLFSLGRPACPVDTHVLRVTKRLGLISPRTTMDQAHAKLESLLAAQDMLPFHLGLVRVGRQVCAPRRPRCDACLLDDLCPKVSVPNSSRPPAKVEGASD